MKDYNVSKQPVQGSASLDYRISFWGFTIIIKVLLLQRFLYLLTPPLFP